MASSRILIAGFGGQGVLFSGKVLAYTGLVLDKEVSWLPSYGPEMRGGTANCSVTVADEQIGSPIVSEPDILIAMNQPSFDKYCDKTTDGSYIIYDSSLIKTDRKTTDKVKVFAIPATQLASDYELPGLANMIIMGKMVKESGIFTKEQVVDAMKKVVSAKKPELLEKNIKAVEIGYDYDN